MPIIRPAAADEVGAVWSLVRRAVADMNAQGNPQWGEDYPARSDYARDQARGELFVALGPGGSLLGAACLNTEQEEAYGELDWEVGEPALAVHRMAVDTACRRQGVGRAFFTFAEELARKQAIPAIHVDTYATNLSMQALLLGLGYRKIGLVHFDPETRPLGFFCYEKVLSGSLPCISGSKHI